MERMLYRGKEVFVYNGTIAVERNVNQAVSVVEGMSIEKIDAPTPIVEAPIACSYNPRGFIGPLTVEALMRKRYAFVARLAKYTMDVESYAWLLHSQAFVCALCGEYMDEPHIDHDHACCPYNGSCGVCVRGLVHSRCNVGMGYFDDSTLKLQMAIDYLQRYRNSILH